MSKNVKILIASLVLFVLTIVVYEICINNDFGLWAVTKSGEKIGFKLGQHKVLVYEAGDAERCFPVYVSDSTILIKTDSDWKVVFPGQKFIFVNKVDTVKEKLKDRKVIYTGHDFSKNFCCRIF